MFLYVCLKSLGGHTHLWETESLGLPSMLALILIKRPPLVIIGGEFAQNLSSPVLDSLLQGNSVPVIVSRD